MADQAYDLIFLDDQAQDDQARPQEHYDDGEVAYDQDLSDDWIESSDEEVDLRPEAVHRRLDEERRAREELYEGAIDLVSDYGDSASDREEEPHDDPGENHGDVERAAEQPDVPRVERRQRNAPGARVDPRDARYRGRYWMFTLHLQYALADAQSDEGRQRLENLFRTLEQGGNVKYAIGQLERGGNAAIGQAANDGLHLQGYVEFNRDLRLSDLRRLYFGGQAHWERRRGNQEQARDYCRKADTRVCGPWELGQFEPMRQGQRSDLSRAVDLLVENKGDYLAVAMEHPTTYVKFHRGIEKLAQMHAKPRDHQTHCIVIHGEPGAGKSRIARDLFPDAYWMPDTPTMWANGYYNQEVVILDDFDPRHCTAQWFLRHVDRYPLMVQTKGGFTNWNPKLLVMMHNQGPATWWGLGIHQEALERRICLEIHAKQDEGYKIVRANACGANCHSHQDVVTKTNTDLANRFDRDISNIGYGNLYN